ncbi:hypothetical protein BN6_21850 [Saccharothrix espanaensis DSM 44229]|uniref:Uncharacterized protein n=1 Tax=Saccharothrix espanaensis (strain ATCC 51144 / DSM 44229 / JCM 9112 / NBRC 15066 / NRRL 15764) TaxID=1179773 RepID=K0JVK4_SACES|nr:hypothetical protein BN6_21850 [Saccharothrix espanaensis DSM 44229]
MLSFTGHRSSAERLGIFEVSVLHNTVHLLFGHLIGGGARLPRAAGRPASAPTTTARRTSCPSTTPTPGCASASRAA